MNVETLNTVLQKATMAHGLLNQATSGLTLIAVPRGDAEEINTAIYTLGEAVQTLRIAMLAEDGKIAVVESGRDCDCVEYSGKVCIVDATFEAVEKHKDEVYEWADGPCYFELMRVSEANGIKYQSRDLVMEAHEEGHPHHIISRFP